MIFAQALLTLTYLGLACATSSTNFVVHENIRIPPRGFTSVGPAPPGQTISLRIALAQANKNAIVDALYSVSDPTSAKYGQHLSKAEVCRHHD